MNKQIQDLSRTSKHKKEVTITINYSIASCDFEDGTKKGEQFISAYADGKNWGSSLIFNNEEELIGEIEKYEDKYPNKLEVIDERFAEEEGVTEKYLRQQKEFATKQEKKLKPKVEYDEVDEDDDFVEDVKKEVIETSIQKLKNIEEQADKDFEKVLLEIESVGTSDVIEDFYFELKKAVKMVANKNVNGLILYGKCGIGKTFNSMRAFKENGTPFVYLNGHLTGLEFYHFLFNHRTENIILDDVNVLKSEINFNMLKACLNSNARIVSYNSSTSKLKVPNKFTFEGTICLLLNKKPINNEDFRAVESRILHYELKMNYEDKIKIITELSKNKYKDLTTEDRTKIVSWINENTNPATINLTLRTLIQLYEVYRYDKDNWERLAKSYFTKKNDEYDLIINGMSSYAWCEKTGKSRRSYFRYKELIK